MSQEKYDRNFPSVTRAPLAATIDTACEILARGELVAFPTETVYGLGADATNPVAVARIFERKGRPSTNPLIVHVDSLGRLLSLSAELLSENQKLNIRLLAQFFPGPLTVVIPRPPEIPAIVSGGGSTVAVRVPRHPVALELLKKFGRPVAAPSANVSGCVSPTTAQHVLESFPQGLELIIDGGPCEVGIESTVLSLSREIPAILRPGGVTKEMIEDALGTPVETGVTSTLNTHSESPGMLTIHYAPQTRVIIEGDQPQTNYPKKVALVQLTKKGDTQHAFPYTLKTVVSRDGSLEDAARNLFATLRALDDGTVDLIVIEPCEETGIGVAIMDRVRRAAAER